ncbi:phosphatase phospho-type [Gorgonomyces haynaldii]|nr:phosphatase phospho-type [Gorgonomyces haynaldii]
MKYLVALDFDFTVIDEDSDHYIFKQLSPPLFEKLEALQGKIQWTDLMNQLLQEVQDLGKTQEDMNSVLETIPFDPAMKRAFEHFSRLSKVVIISDANTFYIDVITRAKGIHPYISQVITNPAILEKRVSIKRHTVEPHGCPKCAVNLCKGRELERYIQEHGPFERVIYGGDGRNDFCPSTRLRKSDLVLVRSNRALDKMLKDPHIRDQIQAQVEFWETASDFESLIKKHVH